MKKIIIISTLLMMSLTGAAISGDLDGMENNLVTLSNGVEGVYYSDSASEDATAFAISTGHIQGNYAYATGSFSTAIHRKDLGDVAFDATTHLLGAPADTAYNTVTLTDFGPAI